MSYEQFVRLTEEYRRVVADAFGTEVKIDISVLDQNRLYSSYHGLVRDYVEMKNSDHKILQTDSLSDVTNDIWKRAKSVRVVIKPVDASKAPKNGFAVVEFKGNFSRRASFYIQPSLPEVKVKMIRNNYGASKVGDGNEQHGESFMTHPRQIISIDNDHKSPIQTQKPARQARGSFGVGPV